MTIEEIFDKEVGEYHRTLSPLNYSNVCNAMNIYAEQTATEFIEWAAKEGWYFNKIRHWSNRGESSTNFIEVLAATKTTAELFTLYKNQNPL